LQRKRILARIPLKSSNRILNGENVTVNKIRMEFESITSESSAKATIYYFFKCNGRNKGMIQLNTKEKPK